MGLLASPSTLLYAAAARKIATRRYHREPPLLGAGHTQRSSIMSMRTTPRPVEAGALLLLIMALLLLVGQLAQSLDLIVGILVTEWLLIGVPLGLLLRWGGFDPIRVLHLRPASWPVLWGAGLAGLSAWYVVAVAVQGLQERVMPMPPELIEQARKALFAADRPLALDLAALALSPAICEELLFRGVLLRASRAVMSARWTILLNGLLFGLFHLDLYRFFPTMLLGIVLAVIVLRSGSIYPAMLFHFLNNACALIVGRMAKGPEVPAGVISPWLVSLALMLFVAGLALLLKGCPPPDSPSEEPASP